MMPPTLRKLLNDARVKQMQAGQIILYEGDRPAEVHVIKAGVVKLHNIDEQGNEKVLHLLQATMAIPLAFFSRAEVPTHWYYTCLTACELYVLPRRELENLMEIDVGAMRFLINTFSEEVHEILTRLDSLGKSDSGSKLVTALRYLAVCHGVKGRGGWWRIPFPVNHQLLADMTGVSRETTSLAMKVLSDKKIVRNPRLAQLEINFERLKAYREEMLAETA